MFYVQRLDETTNVKASYQQKSAWSWQQKVAHNERTQNVVIFLEFLYTVSLKSLIFFVIYVFVIKLEYFR
jgi:hypothetical protein